MSQESSKRADGSRVGLIGLGQAGLSLAQAVLRHRAVVGYDLDANRCELARKAGVNIARSARELAEASDIIMLCLPTPQASRAAAADLAAAQLKGTLIIENSTVSPDDIEWLVSFFAPHGATIMDCAIVGGIHKLAHGEATFLVGASKADYDRARPVLESAAEEIFYLGPTGNGMRVKLIVNGIAHTTMVMLLEGAALAAKSEVPLETFYKLMRRESGLLRPLTHRLGERVFGQDFEGGMNTANARKDSALVLDYARAMQVPLFTMQAAHTVYEIAVNEGLAGQDYAAISKLWERWLDVSFKAAVQTQ
ncbi:MAG: NAD(P)-dependent oxidoreductase [Burkholderiaceae bacterium]|nr:NAD(P)-dependent oxidoreductase [Burkholderiaceae bacterium]MDO9089190.1 NAD(P)-dependent oxidoreductase [Burkholderiaceae bacterium]